MSKFTKVNKKIDNTVVGAYRSVQDTVVTGYRRIEDCFVDTFLRQEGETIAEAKARLQTEAAARAEQERIRSSYMYGSTREPVHPNQKNIHKES